MGWYDYGARMYDPVIARWGSVDPMSELDFEESVYNYVDNDPISRVDLFGCNTKKDVDQTPSEVAATILIGTAANVVGDKVTRGLSMKSDMMVEKQAKSFISNLGANVYGNIANDILSKKPDK